VLLYRVFPYLSSAAANHPGHPLYVHPAQGSGRFDNPSLYLAWYLTAEASSAVGESFADISVWSEHMFEFPHIPSSRRALGIYELPDGLPYVDLDDPQRLLELGIRPSQVVERNRPFTQALAARIYSMGDYNGIRWWSFHRPQWRVYCLWEIDPHVVQVEPLSTGHIAMLDAAETLTKAIA
jgi:RES domain-containing protein